LKDALHRYSCEVAFSDTDASGGSLVWKSEILNADGKLAARGELVTVKVSASGDVTALTESGKHLLEDGA
jgi:acyl-CoA thioesterase FadM